MNWTNTYLKPFGATDFFLCVFLIFGTETNLKAHTQPVTPVTYVNNILITKALYADSRKLGRHEQKDPT